jgi:alkyl hydroperoxide reductase subunit D
MSLNSIQTEIPDFGRDIRLNLETTLTEEGAPGLTGLQIWGVALASSYALSNQPMVAAVLEAAQGQLDDATVEAAKAAATIMAMNNIYYRSQHLMEDPELRKLPARLRMNVIGKPGIAKVDFEIMCFAVSALAGCGQCLTAHLAEIRKAGVSNEGAQSVLRIASVLNATKTALAIKSL